MRLDLHTCTMGDVIAESVTMHPSTLAEALEGVALIHLRAASTMDYHKASRDVAMKMHAEAYGMARGLREDGELDPGALTFSETIIAFGAACRLLCIPRHVGSAIAARHDAMKRSGGKA